MNNGKNKLPVYIKILNILPAIILFAFIDIDTIFYVVIVNFVSLSA